MDKLVLALMNLALIAVLGALAALLWNMPWQFAAGCLLTAIIFHIAHWAKHGYWWTD